MVKAANSDQEFRPSLLLSCLYIWCFFAACLFLTCSRRRDSTKQGFDPKTNEAKLLSIVAHIRRVFARIIGVRIISASIMLSSHQCISVSLLSSPHRCSDRRITHFVAASVFGSSLYRSFRRRIGARIVSLSITSSSCRCSDRFCIARFVVASARRCCAAWEMVGGRHRGEDLHPRWPLSGPSVAMHVHRFTANHSHPPLPRPTHGPVISDALEPTPFVKLCHCHSGCWSFAGMSCEDLHCSHFISASTHGQPPFKRVSVSTVLEFRRS